MTQPFFQAFVGQCKSCGQTTHIDFIGRCNKCHDRDEREAAGRAAYEEDVRRCPTYMFGTDPETGKPTDGTVKRRSWDEIDEAARESWRENPNPTDYYG